MKIFTKRHYITFMLLLILCLHVDSITAFASAEDPGAGRLSGESISSDFYGDTPSIQYPLHQYGSRKIKSPYTGTKYTHQTKFDGRTILHGIDVSRWQGEIDWKKVKADGIDYAFIQVGFRGYGSSGILNDATKDPYFDANMQNAIAAGIKVGVYVFSQATTQAEAIEEAEYILDAIGNYPISMPLVMDFEYASTDSGLGGRLYKAKLSKAKATNVCMAFCKEIAAAGYTPMVYANKSMLSDQINASKLTNAGYRIWLANYTKNTTYSGTYDFWQYSEKGKVKGIKGDVDMNFYYVQAGDNFAPDPYSISASQFTQVEDQTYTGKAIIPEVTVTRNGTPLTPNVDYTITYSDNTKIGTATISITGIGQYCDTRKIHFDILPKAPTSLKAKKKTKNYITLSWKKDSAVTGYEIYRATTVNGTYKKLKTINKKSTTTYKNTKLSAGKCYYYQIRSYKKTGGTTYYSAFTPIKNIYTQTGYTRNAIAKSKVAIYDLIPGTKTDTIMVPDENATTEDSTTENSTTEEPSTEESNTESSATEEPSTEETNTESSTTEEPSTEETNTESSATEEPSTEESNTENPATGEPSTEESNTESSTTEESTENGSSNENPTIPMKEVTVSVDSTPLIEIAKKTKVKVIYSTTYKKKTWYYVSYQKGDATYKGFVQGSKVTITKSGKVVKTKKVNVRKKASVYSKKLTTLKKNTKVDILKTKKKAGVTWYQVQYKKKNKTYKGWISAPYIKLV